PGTVTYWPALVPAEEAGAIRFFDFSMKAESPLHEPIVHHFRVPATGVDASSAQTSGKAFRLPDLYLFPPGESDMNW
ncbi:MAG: competence protein ComFB, partial [Treponema sp.]|nr:competence protein ComFB [Treponema sp.]